MMSDMPTFPAALTRELGVPDPHLAQWAGIPGAPTYAYETTREMVYPYNLAVIDRMRTTDPQVAGILRSTKQPQMATAWRVPADEDDYASRVDPVTGDVVPLPQTQLGNTARDVDPRVREFCEAELGLTLDRRGRRRARKGGVSWDEFLRHAMLCLEFGHMGFEQVYALGPHDVTGLTRLGQAAHLRKLAPRMPRSLSGIQVAPDGGLASITQPVPLGQGSNYSRDVTIPVDRLVWFAWDREGGDWAGRSILRPGYKDWLIKDVLLRVSALAVERTGMGTPVVTYPENERGARELALEIARAYKAGEDSGVALKQGWHLDIVGVTGSIVDALPLLNYHDQQMSKALLNMVLDLGHDAGARALGDTFVSIARQFQNGLSRFVEEVVTEHVVRDLVRLNFGEDEPYPVVAADVITDELTAEALSSLASSGLLGNVAGDHGLLQEVRKRFGMPPAPAPTPPPTPQLVPGALDVPGAIPTARPAGAPGVSPAVVPSDTAVTPPAAPTPAVAASAAADDLHARAARVASIAAALAAA